MPKRLKKVRKGDAAAKGTQQAIPFHHDKGQHILVNPGVMNRIVEKAAIQPSDAVMEVGSGTGNITVRLLERARIVYACEIDMRMVAELQKRVVATPTAHRLTVVPGDVLKTMGKLKFDVIVANLPYQISSPFVNALLTHRPVPRCAVIMFQKEFADRLTAKPGMKHYSRLSLNVQLLAKVEHLMTVKRGDFRPPPQVDSAVVRIEPIVPPPPINFQEWDGLTRVVFLRKNRTIQASMNQKGARADLFKIYMRECAKHDRPQIKADEFKTKLDGIMRSNGLSSKRPRSMDIDDFLRMLLAFNKEGVHFA